MDEYQGEIAELQAQVDAMVEAEADRREIAELQMQLDVLSALHRQATGLWEAGRSDPGLRARLALRGYGDWSFDNVYAFVFDSSVELPVEGPRAFLAEINETDFARLLDG